MLMRAVKHSLIREASMHLDQGKQLGITADMVRKVSEVGIMQCGFIGRLIDGCAEESYEVQVLETAVFFNSRGYVASLQAGLGQGQSYWRDSTVQQSPALAARLLARRFLL